VRPWALGEGTYVASLYQLCSLGSAVGTPSRIWGSPRNQTFLFSFDCYEWLLVVLKPGCHRGIPVSCFIVVLEVSEACKLIVGNIVMNCIIALKQKYCIVKHFITFCVSRRRRKMYCGHACVCMYVCVSVCLPVRGHTPTLLHVPGCNLGAW